MPGTSPGKVYPESPLSIWDDSKELGEEHFEFLAEPIGGRTDLGSHSYIVEASDSRVPNFLTSMSRNKRNGWRYPCGLIEFDESIGFFLWTKIKKLVIDQRWFQLVNEELESIKEPYRSCLHSFLVNAWAYSEAVPSDQQDIPLPRIIERSLKEGPAFAKYLDGLKSWLMTLKCSRQNFSDELKETYQSMFFQAKFKGVGDIYRSNQLFPWQPPRPDIVEITATKPEQLPKALEDFRQEIRKFLQKEKLLFFKPNNDYKVHYSDNTKMAQEGPNWKLRPGKPALYRGRSRVAFIPRELKEARAAVVEEQDSVLRIKWIDAEVRRILQADKRAKMETRPNVLYAQLVDAVKERTRFNHKTRRKELSQRWSYCRDFKKEGLTKDRTLVRIMLEELHRRWPESGAFECPWFFDNWTFELDGQLYEAGRGHGLGMCNALTTLMQIGIEEVTRGRFETETGLTDSFYLNDDAALIFESERQARRYAEIDRNVCDNLGLSYKAKSTFLARQHVTFCELYVGLTYLNDKSCFSYCELANLCKAINASHARSLALSMNLRNVPRRFISRCVMYWGPVLYSNEFTRPRALGGWFRAIERGVDVSFINENALRPVQQMEEAANYSYLQTRLEYKPWLKLKSLKTKRALSYPAEWLQERGEKLEIEANSTFRAESNIDNNVRAWKTFEKILKLNFRKNCRWWAKNPSRRRLIRDIYRTEADSRPKEDIIPPIYEREETSSFEAAFTDDSEFEHPYRTPSQDIDLLLYKKGLQITSYPRKMGITEPMSLHGKDSKLRNLKGPAKRAIALRHLYGTGKVPLKVWNVYLVPDQATFKFWHYPFHIGAVADAWSRNYNSYIPTYVPEEKKKLLQERDLHYGRELSWREWMLIGQVHPADITMLWLLRETWQYQNVYGENTQLENLVKGMKIHPGLGVFLNTIEKWDIENIASLYEKWILAHKVLELKRKITREEKNAQQRIMESEITVIDVPNKVVEDEFWIQEYYDSRNDPEGLYEELGVQEVIEQTEEELLDSINFPLPEEEDYGAPAGFYEETGVVYDIAEENLDDIDFSI